MSILYLLSDCFFSSNPNYSAACFDSSAPSLWPLPVIPLSSVSSLFLEEVGTGEQAIPSISGQKSPVALCTFVIISPSFASKDVVTEPPSPPYVFERPKFVKKVSESNESPPRCTILLRNSSSAITNGSCSDPPSSPQAHMHVLSAAKNDILSTNIPARTTTRFTKAVTPADDADVGWVKSPPPHARPFPARCPRPARSAHCAMRHCLIPARNFQPPCRGPVPWDHHVAD